MLLWMTGSRAPTAARDPGGLADAAVLGLPALAGLVTHASDGITVCDSHRRFVYANPAACAMLGFTLEELRGRDFLSCIAPREHPTILVRLSNPLGESASEQPAPFTCNLLGPDGTEREIVYSQFVLDVEGRPHGVAIFQDMTGPRAANRAAVLLAQTMAQVGIAGADEILADIARHAVDATRALACGMATVEDGTLTSAGGYGLERGIDEDARGSLRLAFVDISGDDVIEAMTDGAIIVGTTPGKPVVLSNARTLWQSNAVTRPWVAMVDSLDWETGVYVPLSWQNRVIGVFAVYLPSGLAGPTEAELAFYTALADQAAVAHINSRLNTQAKQAATYLERARIARELHDSVSQELFSMTMNVGAARLAMAEAGLDDSGPIGRSIVELAELIRGASAEMRALVFELRPAALIEEGLVAGLRKQAAALSGRGEAQVTVHGPDTRLDLQADVEEHLYRITSEALHNVIKHSGADAATVRISFETGSLSVQVHDNGGGFDPHMDHPGHLGLRTMAERAGTIGAELSIASASGRGTTLTVSLPADAGHADAEHAEAVGQMSDPPRPEGVRADPRDPVGSAPSAVAGGVRPAEGGASEQPGDAAPRLSGSSRPLDAAALGLTALAGVLAGAQEAILISNASRRFVYVNPAACRLLGRSPAELLGQQFLSFTPAREYEFRLARLSELRRGTPVRFSGTVVDSEGAEHEGTYSVFQTEIAGSPHTAAFVRDVTGARAAARDAVALAQAASQLVGTGSVNEILSGIARHAVEGTRALVCGISTVDDDDRYAEGGGFGPWSSEAAGNSENVGWAGFEEIPHGQVISALTGGSIVVGKAPSKPLVLPDVRSVWMAYPVLEPLVATLDAERPGGGIFFPLFWEGRVFGLFTVCLPPGIAGPNEAELAFCTALADQATIAVINSRLNSRARQVAALAERTRLARDLHDSISQALFSMTMHARAAQLAMPEAGVGRLAPLGRAIAELAALARGAMAQMRALIFELRPESLAQEGLVAALGKQAAALMARAETVITVQGPTARLGLDTSVEEHLYRIASEALHHVVSHGGTGGVAVSVTQQAGLLEVAIRSDDAGRGPGDEHPGHIDLSAMAERATKIGAALAVSGTPGRGTNVLLSLALDDREDQVAEDLD